jgi:hypothetical protein
MTQKLIKVWVESVVPCVLSNNTAPKAFMVRTDGDSSAIWQPLSNKLMFPNKVQKYLKDNLAADPESFLSDETACLIPKHNVESFADWLKQKYECPDHYVNCNKSRILRSGTDTDLEGSAILSEHDLEGCSLLSMNSMRSELLYNESDQVIAVRFVLKLCLRILNSRIYNKFLESDEVSLFSDLELSDHSEPIS